MQRILFSWLHSGTNFATTMCLQLFVVGNGTSVPSIFQQSQLEGNKHTGEASIDQYSTHFSEFRRSSALGKNPSLTDIFFVTVVIILDYQAPVQPRWDLALVGVVHSTYCSQRSIHSSCFPFPLKLKTVHPNSFCLQVKSPCHNDTVISKVHPHNLGCLIRWVVDVQRREQSNICRYLHERAMVL